MEGIAGGVCVCGGVQVTQAIDTALKAQKDWAAMDFESRASIFLKVSALLCLPRGNGLSSASHHVCLLCVFRTV